MEIRHEYNSSLHNLHHDCAMMNELNWRALLFFYFYGYANKREMLKLKINKSKIIDILSIIVTDYLKRKKYSFYRKVETSIKKRKQFHDNYIAYKFIKFVLSIILLFIKRDKKK